MKLKKNHVEFTTSWILTPEFVLVTMSEGAVNAELIMCVDKIKYYLTIFQWCK